MIIDELSFEYNGLKSKDYGLVFAHMDTSEFKKAYGGISINAIHNKRNNMFDLTGVNYDDSRLSIEVEIIKACHKSNYDFITLEEQKFIEPILFLNNRFNELKFEKTGSESIDSVLFETVEQTIRDEDGSPKTESVEKHLFLNCMFVNPERIYNGSDMLIGYKCTLECDSNMFVQSANTHYIRLNNETKIVEVNIDSHELGFIYPIATIKVSDNVTGGYIEITNLSDDANRITKFSDVGAGSGTGQRTGQTIALDGNRNYVSKYGYDHFDEFNFIRLKRGNNELRFEGNIDYVILQWNNKRLIL